MNFIKRNYEKVLLLIFFLIFSGVLAHMFNIVQATKEIKDSHLEIPTREAEYKEVDRALSDFNIEKSLAQDIAWDASKNRDKKYKDFYSDLLETFELARCGHCERLIPIKYFDGKSKCPVCNKALLAPKKEDELSANEKLAADSDKDGIPDMVEIENGLKPYDYRDALSDLDGDGFVNVYEFMEKTDIKNPKSHPMLAVGLSIEKIERQQLRVALIGINVIKNRPKNTWRIQLRLKKLSNGVLVDDRDIFHSIGDIFRINNKRYKITDIIPYEVEKVIDGKKQKVMTGRVTITDSKNRVITMVENEIVYDPDDRIYFNYVFDEEKRNRIVGGRISLGSREIGYEYYKIISLNREKFQVVLQKLIIKVVKKRRILAVDTKVKDIIVGKKAIMPEKFMPMNIKEEDTIQNEKSSDEMPEAENKN